MVLETKTGVNPAANTECGDTVTAGHEWILRSYAVTLVRDGNAANVIPTLIFKDAGGNELLRLVVGTNITANQTVRIQASTFSTKPSDVSGTVVYLTLPLNFKLGAGYTITTSTASIQAGDNYGAPVMQVDDFNISG